MNPGKTNLEAEFSMERAGIEIPEDPPFHILVAGDFSGAVESVKSLKTIQIDRDDFSDVMRRIAPKIFIPTGDSIGIELEFKELDDFHPDHLFKTVGLFADLRDLRARLVNEESFSAAASEVRTWFSDEPGETVEQPPVQQIEVEGSEGLLEDILGSRTREAAAYKLQKSSLLKDFVKEVVDPFIVKVDEDEQAKLLAAVDSATSGIMRKILRNREFQRLESAWRGLYLMCRRIETSNELKIFVLDLSKERFEEELKTESQALTDLLLSGSAANGNEPWAVITGIYDFDLNVDDAAALIRMGSISGISGAPFVSHIRPGMLGIRSFGETPDFKAWDTKSDTPAGKLWTALRSSPDAGSIGLATPRLLSRLPYGKDTDPTEVFSFEEFDGLPLHDDYLWMNPAFGFAIVIAASFSRHGWEMGGRYELDVSGLPVHVYSADEGTKTKPCAEIEMTDAALDILLEEGLMPFASFKNTDRVRLGGIQSVKFPAKGLKGRWQ